MWRVVERWALLTRTVCHGAWRLQCVDECVRTLRHLSLVHVTVGRPVLRACRAARLLQSVWRLLPYHRGSAAAHAVVMVQRMVRQARRRWVSRVAQLGVPAGHTLVAPEAAVVPAVEVVAATTAVCVHVCAPCGEGCAGEEAFWRHCMSDPHAWRSGIRGFAGCLPNTLGECPPLSRAFFQRLLDPAPGASASPQVRSVGPASVLNLKLLSARMRLVSAMAPALAVAAAALAARAAARLARVEAVVLCSPRTMESWRVGVHSGRVVYYDTAARASRWAHPLSGSSAWPLVAVADAVVAHRMWPPIGSPWEVAVAATGGICYRHTDTDEVRWAPPPGSRMEPAGPVYPPPVGLVVPGMLCDLAPRVWGSAIPPVHARPSMLASPAVEGEREPRWLGQWDAVVCEHVFVHRLTRAVRRGPWVSMPSTAGRIYYLNLRTAWSRWDPPPLWEAGWVRRASQVQGAVEAGQARFPVAVPRGREVCGGAPVGADVAAALRPCVEEVVAVVLGPCGERATDGHGAALTHLAVAYGDPAFEQHLSDVRVCLEAMAAAVSLRFAVPCSAVVSALWRLGPAWAGVDPAYLVQCLAGSGGGQQSATLSLVQEAACEISSGLQSAGSLVVVLLPLLIAAGAGFHACPA